MASRGSTNWPGATVERVNWCSHKAKHRLRTATPERAWAVPGGSTTVNACVPRDHRLLAGEDASCGYFTERPTLPTATGPVTAVDQRERPAKGPS